MRVLLVTAGSHGDINPFIAIGRALRARGHQAVMVANPYYQRQITDAGVEFQACGEYIDLKRIGEEVPDIMHPHRGTKVVVDTMLVPTSRDAFHRVRQLAAAQRVHAVVSHCICPGAMWAAQSLGIPCAHVVLAPINWVSRMEPIVGNGWMPPEPVWFMRALLRAIMLPIFRHMFDPPLARLRAELGLPPQKGLIMDAMRGGALNLAMWSPVFRGPLADDPPQGRMCGFPWHDQHAEVEAPPQEVQRFLDAGEPPILFCLGTAAVHVAGDFYEHAAEACRMLGRRGLLLVGPTRLKSGPMAAARLPDGVRAFEYAPFSAVMPQCAVNVHHGGVGSTGQGLRAGRPTVIIPHAHDQWDNAARVFRMGVSQTLPRHRVTAKRLAAALDVVLRDRQAEEKAAECGRRMAGEDGAGRAAELVEGMVGKG